MTERRMTSVRISGGTERTKRQRNGVQFDFYFARCICCGTKHSEGATTTRAARAIVAALGWTVERVRTPVHTFGYTNSWRVLCPSCSGAEKEKAPKPKPGG